MNHFRQPMLVVFWLAAATLWTGCASAPPRIVIEPAQQELGEVPQQLIELTFTVRNTGGQPLTIQKISTSCDCTTAEISSRDIPAGGTAELKVSLDPREDNLYGSVTRVVYLRSNDPNQPEAQAEFHALIQQP